MHIQKQAETLNQSLNTLPSSQARAILSTGRFQSVGKANSGMKLSCEMSGCLQWAGNACNLEGPEGEAGRGFENYICLGKGASRR